MAVGVFTVACFPWLVCLESGVRTSPVTPLRQSTWMRLNHLALLLQRALFSCTIARPPLGRVQAHATSSSHAHTAALYDTNARWVHPRTSSRGATNSGGEGLGDKGGSVPWVTREGSGPQPSAQVMALLASAAANGHFAPVSPSAAAATTTLMSLDFGDSGTTHTSTAAVSAS